jgi:two-component system sensor histidine kinase/response regulator
MQILNQIDPPSGPPLESVRRESKADNQTSCEWCLLRILLAEDNTINQQVTLLLLRKLGYQADLVSNGEEVLAALEQADYDLILMDVEMPEMDGLTATQQIRAKYPQRQRPWIVAVTAYAIVEDLERCLAIGMNDYLSKPIQIEELENVLNQAMTQLGLKGGIPESALKSASEMLPATTAIGSEERVLEPKVLDSICKLGGAQGQVILQDIIQEYLATAPSLLQQIKTAIAAMDIKVLRQSAHTLGSSSINLGAIPFAKQCKVLENLARGGDLSQARSHWPALATEYEKVKMALQNECKDD